MDPTKGRSLVISVVDFDVLGGQPRFALAIGAVVIFVAFPLGTDVDSGVRVIIEEGLNNALGCVVPILSKVRDYERSKVFGLDIRDDGEDVGHARVLVQWWRRGGHFGAFVSSAAKMIPEG